MTVGDWSLTVTGEIVRVDREDVDKSGRNPKLFLTFVIRPDRAPEAPAGATVPAEPAIRIAERELARLTDTPPVAGERVELTARASGPRPATFYLTGVRRV